MSSDIHCTASPVLHTVLPASSIRICSAHSQQHHVSEHPTLYIGVVTDCSQIMTQYLYILRIKAQQPYTEVCVCQYTVYNFTSFTSPVGLCNYDRFVCLGALLCPDTVVHCVAKKCHLCNWLQLCYLSTNFDTFKCKKCQDLSY